jgi:hypothetical protein
MNTKQTIWLAPVVAVILFGIGLVGTVYFNTGAITAFNITVGTDYPLLVRVNALVQDVDTLSDGFEDVTGGERRSQQALVGQAQRVHAQLRTLGALPGQTVLAARLTQEFEAWYRPAMKARIPPAQEQGGPGAGTDAMRQHYAVLHADLQQARQHALRRFTESASASQSGPAARPISLTNDMARQHRMDETDRGYGHIVAKPGWPAEYQAGKVSAGAAGGQYGMPGPVTSIRT